MPFWETSAFWGIIGLVGGAIVTAIFFIIGKQRKTLEYTITSTNLITKDMTSIPGLSVSFDGQAIENLVSSEIRFRNTGNQMIDPSDFALSAPLKITASEKFLNLGAAPTVSTPNKASNIHVELNDKAYLIKFDFIKKKQDFSLTLLHSGSISVSGELKDGKVQSFVAAQKSTLLAAALYTTFVVGLCVSILVLYACGVVSSDLMYKCTFGLPVLLMPVAVIVTVNNIKTIKHFRSI